MPTPLRHPIIEDMTIANSRALTDETKRITFAASGLSFRDYNKLYEDWLSKRYRDDIEPFTNRNPQVYDPYITESGLQMILDHNERATIFSRMLEERAATAQVVEHFAQLWRKTGQLKREELVLAVWKDQCTRAEKGRYIWAREDTPELTLSWATGNAQDGTPNWIRLWLNQAQTEEEKKRSESPYRNLRNHQWDRVNGVFEIENSLVPVKKSIRAFVQDGIARRNLHLRQFVQELSCRLIGVDLNTPPNVQSRKTADEKDEAEMIARLQDQNVSIKANMQSESVSCASCLASGNLKPVKLHCSTCKSKMNRIIRYCSSECQLQHWKAGHRQVCGKPLSDSLSIPSLAPSNRTSTETSFDSNGNSELSTRFNQLAISSKSPRTRLRSMTYNMMIQSPVCCWIQFHGEPDAFDPRKPLDAIPVDVTPTANSRFELRRTLRSIALEFLADESEDEDLLNLATVVISSLTGRSSKETRHIRWFAKLIGREGKEAEDFLQKDYPARLEKGLELVKTREEYRAIQKHFEDLEAESSGSDCSREIETIPSQIRADLEQDPEAFWYTSHPGHPELTMAQMGFRVGGPILDETSNSKFAKQGNKLILVEALRRQAFLATETPLSHDALWAIGIILLALTAGAGPRCRKWVIWRTGHDLGIPEMMSEKLMVMMKKVVDRRQDQTGEIMREALQRLTEQDTIDDDTFPALSTYADPAPLTSQMLQTIAFVVSSADARDEETTRKKKKKNKKKRNKKKGKKESTEGEFESEV